MTSVALLTIILCLSVGITTADGQGFRGSAGGARSSGVSMQTAPAAFQSRQGFVNTSGTAAAPMRTFAPTQSVQTQTIAPNQSFGPTQSVQPQSIAPVPVHHPVLHSIHRGTVFVAPPLRVSQRPVVVLDLASNHHSQPRFFHRQPGIAIVEWPYDYWPTVITQVAPGVISAAPRYAEEPPSEARTRSPGQLAPFDPTPREVVERMLILAKVKSGDVLYDLGAGDGRVVIAAAKKYGIRAVGFEIDPGLVKLARENVRQQGVEQLVEIREQDFLTADLTQASVVTLYLSYDGNLALRPQLMRQLRAGARIVSYTFDMGEWQPKISETYRDAGGDAHAIYFWQIGDTIAFR